MTKERTRDPVDGQPTDQALAAGLAPLLRELLHRLVVRGEGSHAARVVHVLAYVVADFGNPKALPAPADTATRPLFVGGDADGVETAGGWPMTGSETGGH